jgi:hypothetical protein
MRWRERIAAAAALVTAVLLATNVWPGIRGPENWRWGFRPLESFAGLLPLCAVFAAQLGVATRIRAVWAAGRNRVRLPWLGAAVVLAFLQMLLLTAAEPGGLSNLPRRVIDPAFTSYHTIARRADDTRAFLQRYPHIQSSFPVHGPSQPPGRVLFFRAVNDWAGASPERTERLLALGASVGGVPRGPAGTTDAERAGAVAAGILLVVLGSLCLVPLVSIVGGRCHGPAVGNAVLLMSLVPSFLLFTPQTDHLILLLTMTSAAMLLEAMRFASRSVAALLAMAAGVAAGLSLFVSFTTLAALGAWAIALAGMVTFAVRRGSPLPRPRASLRLAAGFAAGFALPIAILHVMGLDWIAVFRECLAAADRVQRLGHGRAYATWVTWNLWDFALFLGIPLTVVWLGRVRDEIAEWRRAPRLLEDRRTGALREPDVFEAPFALALLAALLALDVSGRILGETGRIWMFLMPLAVAAAALSYGRRPLTCVLPLAIAQFIVLLALRGWVNVPG